MSLKLMGKKRGMTSLFDENGNLVVCTVISAEPNIITQIKRKESDGYEAIQISAFKIKPSKVKGYQGVMKRHNFAGGPAAHGSGFHRHGGSCGMRTSPGRCLPGQKKAGRMGN